MITSMNNDLRTELLSRHAKQHEMTMRALELMKALPSGEVMLRNIAYLEDRVREGQGRPQLYGTQYAYLGDTAITPVIEDPTNLEKRRQAVGLGSYQAELAQVNNEGEAR